MSTVNPEVMMSVEQREWCYAARTHGGSFVSSFAETMLLADIENTAILLPVLVRLMEKYPKYSDGALA